MAGSWPIIGRIFLMTGPCLYGLLTLEVENLDHDLLLVGSHDDWSLSLWFTDSWGGESGSWPIIGRIFMMTGPCLYRLLTLEVENLGYDHAVLSGKYTNIVIYMDNTEVVKSLNSGDLLVVVWRKCVPQLVQSILTWNIGHLLCKAHTHTLLFIILYKQMQL